VPTNGTLGTPVTATLSILDDDSPPALQFSPTAFSGGEGDGVAIIEVSLSIAQSLPVTVTYATSNGTATAGADYTAISNQQLVFAPFQTSRTFNVTLTDDALDELGETVNLVLSNPQNAVLGVPNDVGTLTIVDNDDAPTVQFSASDYSVSEGSGSATITADLSAPSAFTVTVNYSSSDFTALAGSDYAAVGGTLTFAPGATQATFGVPIVNDALDEADEVANLALSSPSNATLGPIEAAALTIADNDATPTVQFSSSAYSSAEGAGTATITVMLSAPSGLSVSVDYATGGGTATSGADYGAEGATLDFAAGETIRTFTVTIMDDAAVEGDETINLTLSNPDEVTLGTTSTAVLTILDDESEVHLHLPLVLR
jgi:Calx-beta domain-containing protein